jgi:hypothetical protein
MSASELIQDLQHVPEIIAGLGLSIASAQHALNVEYLDALERVIALAKSLRGDAKLTDKDDQAFIEALIKQLAPARYQYTETTLAVRLNLAQRMDASTQVGLGVGFGAVSVNAAFAMAYGFDYQAAAECKTVIHAREADTNVMDKLLARATAINDKALDLPAQHPHEKELIAKASTIFEKLVGTPPTKPVTVKPPQA